MIIFLSTPTFRSRYVLLIQLCSADLINSAAIILTGLNRIDLYSTAYNTQAIPIRTSFQCSQQLWLILKLIGDLLIPISTFWMGFERFTAINFPLFYRFHVDGKAVKFCIIPGLSALFVICSILAGIFISHKNDHLTDFYCGRKAAFGDGYGAFIYISTISFNCLATLLNAASYIKAIHMSKTHSRMQKQVAIIRYYLCISTLSTLLVSLPNSIALFQLFIKHVSDSISKPAYWMQTINSGIHFFVYLALNKDFRGRTKRIFSHRESEDNLKEKRLSCKDDCTEPAN
ncbi:unnamed protein product [Auanema sp. JU1783]|nr:unnamed protein product [Auanema sp. JU1783]